MAQNRMMPPALLEQLQGADTRAPALPRTRDAALDRSRGSHPDRRQPARAIGEPDHVPQP